MVSDSISRGLEHTPGPWRFELDADFVNLRYFITEDVKLPTCAIAAAAEEADARLIAAAPELLAACKELAERLQIHSKHTEDLIALMTADKAVKKAEGRSNG